MTLTADEFIRRFPLHSLPPRVRRIRHYGLFAGRTKKRSLARCRELPEIPAESVLPSAAQIRAAIYPSRIRSAGVPSASSAAWSGSPDRPAVPELLVSFRLHTGKIPQLRSVVAPPAPRGGKRPSHRVLRAHSSARLRALPACHPGSGTEPPIPRSLPAPVHFSSPGGPGRSPLPRVFPPPAHENLNNHTPRTKIFPINSTLYRKPPPNPPTPCRTIEPG